MLIKKTCNLREHILYETNADLIGTINSNKLFSWTARHYDFMNNKSLAEIVNMSGGKNAKNFRYKIILYFKNS